MSDESFSEENHEDQFLSNQDDDDDVSLSRSHVSMRKGKKRSRLDARKFLVVSEDEYGPSDNDEASAISTST